MAASAGTAWAVVDPDPFRGLADELYRSPVGTNAWARVGTMTAAQAVFATSGRAAWFASSAGTGSGEYVWATAGGVHWNKYPFRCPGTYYQPAGIAATSPSHVLITRPRAGRAAVAVTGGTAAGADCWPRRTASWPTSRSRRTAG
ncbi:MAG: hypothetical protein ABSA53_38675 [Streptosporangiaceae bacterium]|jgi:hypothetical protein